MSSARHIHTVDPVYAPPVLRAPSPTDTISTEYGPDETTLYHLTLTDEEFAKRVDEEIGLRKTKCSDTGTFKPIILPRTHDSKEEAAMFERVMVNLRGEVKALEEEELFESVSLKNPGPAFAQEPTPRDIDVIMQSMLPASNTGGATRGFALAEPKANGDYSRRVMGQRNENLGGGF